MVMISLSNAVMWVQFLVRKLRSHMPCGQKPKHKTEIILYPVLLENLHGMSCSGTCWLLGGAWFQCRYRVFWMSSYQLLPGIRSFLVFSGFGFKPPASGFQSYSYGSLKTSLSI